MPPPVPRMRGTHSQTVPSATPGRLLRLRLAKRRILFALSGLAPVSFSPFKNGDFNHLIARLRPADTVAQHSFLPAGNAPKNPRPLKVQGEFFQRALADANPGGKPMKQHLEEVLKIKNKELRRGAMLVRERLLVHGFGEITYVKISPEKGCGFAQSVHRRGGGMAINQMQGYPIENSRV
ncbi:hypothetical protein QBC44DRAFT_388244 [Cladorrhinum sp. PSN332]|nr:hypothetical protein QBC44DRAFT_388244 [Cladorrhinum sp. PSN332]